MQIKIHNDGKKKYQSYEAFIDDLRLDTGYGENEETALLELKENLEELKRRVKGYEESLNKVLASEATALLVDYKGDEIKTKGEY